MSQGDPALAGFHWVNMVRAKQVKQPSQWEHCGYQEIVSPKKRYRIINRKELARLLNVEEDNLSKTYQGWIKKALRGGYLSRDASWSRGLAVGDEEFVMKIKESQRRLARPVQDVSGAIP